LIHRIPRLLLEKSQGWARELSRSNSAALRRGALGFVVAQFYAYYLGEAGRLHGDAVDHVGGVHHALAVGSCFFGTGIRN
jgi:hypothetical protein